MVGLRFGKNGAMATTSRLRPDRRTVPLAAGIGTAPSGSAKRALGGIIGGSAAAGVLAAGSSALALYFARRVITPSIA